MANSDGVDFVKMQSDIAVLLSICQDTREDIGEVKENIKNHGVRIRRLEVSQTAVETRLQAEMRNKGAVSIAIAAVTAWLSSRFG